MRLTIAVRLSTRGCVESAMTVYKINVLREAGKVAVAHVIERDSDAEAIAHALQFDHPDGMHIWDGARIVAGFPLGITTPSLKPKRRRGPR